MEKPIWAKPLLPTLLPLLEKAKVETSDPEVRGVCEKAYKTLCHAAGEADNFVAAAGDKPIDDKPDVAVVKTHLEQELGASLAKLKDEWADVALAYAAGLAASASHAVSSFLM